MRVGSTGKVRAAVAEFALLTVVVTAVLAAAGCGGSSQQSSAPRAPTTTRSSATTSTTTPPPDLRLQALAVHDLPAGWTVDRPSANTTEPPACLKTVRHPAHALARLNESFIGDTSGIPAFDETLDTFNTVADADTALTHADSVLDGCRQITWNVGAATLTGGMRRLSLSAFGDESRAFQLLLTGMIRGLNVTIDFDVAVVRMGNTVVLTALGDTTVPDTTLLTSLTGKAVAKLGAGVA